MRFLLDTQALLWWLADDPRLGPEARRLIANQTPMVSPAALWEIAIKAALGKLAADTGAVAREVTAQGMERLAILDSHLAHVQSLPMHHRDPFDRMLVAQAMVEGVPLMTADAAISQYECEVIDASR